MGKIKFKLNRQGVRELMKSDAMVDVLNKYATTVKNNAGAGYGSDIKRGKNRANVAIYPITKEANKECYNNNTLLKALHD